MKVSQVVDLPLAASFLPVPFPSGLLEPAGLHPEAPCVDCNPESPEDDQLVQRCLAGDEQAWAELVHRYRGLVYNIAVRFGGTRDDAADILQAVCIEILNDLSQLRSVHSFRSWLITVTMRQCARWKRKQRGEVPLDAVEPDAEEISVAAGMPETVWQGEQTRLLREGIARLPKRNAEMVRLLFFENPPVPYEEVARRLGLARGSIGFIRGRTLAKLRKILFEAGYDRQGIR